MRGKSRKKTSTAHKKESVATTSTLSFVFRCATAGSRGQRKIRESRKRGHKKPQVSCTPFCKEPAARRQHPPAPGGARPRTPQRASPLRRVAAETPHGFNPYRMPQIPYTPYKGQASRCTRRVRAWKGPEHRRPRCQYCGLRGTSRPYRRRPDQRGRADRSAR